MWSMVLKFSVLLAFTALSTLVFAQEYPPNIEVPGLCILGWTC